MKSQLLLISIFSAGLLKAQFTTASFKRTDFIFGGGSKNAQGVACADFNGDGKPEVIVSATNAQAVYIFKNLSSPGSIDSSSLGTPISLATPGNTNDISTGDLDGDGKADLAVTTLSTSTFSVFRNTSSGSTLSFSTAMNISSISPDGIAIADFDGDGKMDIVTCAQNAMKIAVYLNQSTTGNISFANRIEYSVGTKANSVTVGDLDGDGKKEIITSNSVSNTLSVFKNQSSSGTLAFTLLSLNLPAPAEPEHPRVADIDGDGKADLVFSSFYGTQLCIYKNATTGSTISFSSSRMDFDLDTITNYAQGSAIADYNNDGKTDIGIANHAGYRIAVFRNLSSPGTITLDTRVDFAASTKPNRMAAADIDGDGKPDMISSNYSSSSISVFHNRISAATGNLPEVPLTGNSFAAFPNPASSGITVQGEVSFIIEGIFDMKGRLVQKVASEPSTTHLLDVTGLPAGYYLLGLKPETGGLIYKKLIRY